MKEQRMEAPAYGDLWFERLVDALEDELNGILPEVFTQRINGGLYLVRAQSECTIEPQQTDTASVVLRHRGAAAFRGVATINPEAVYELTADLVGFFCGAPLETMSIFPHRAPRAELPKRGRRRRSMYDGRGGWAVERSSAAFFNRKDRARTNDGS
jgi:hypothetical protein